uniref:Uncharacterized protein n=1 Tax=Arundo donax TaxID=35708 RepID=A0A0A9FZN7_ARUDO
MKHLSTEICTVHLCHYAMRASSPFYQ